jgi:O-antigen ligase
MLKRLGIENGLDSAILLSLILLVAIAPLGNEATHPVVLGMYRTLLFIITVASIIRTRQQNLPQVSFHFLALVTVVLLAMYGSVVLRSGAHFEGIYTFYENALFLAAFIALASFNRATAPKWKHLVLGSIVVIQLMHLAAALAMAWEAGTRPLLGTFVNPNYFASYLLVGISVCTATVLLAKTLPVRAGALIAGLILFYGIGQTASRGAFLSVLALLSVALFRTARKHRIAWWRIAVAGILLLVVTAALNPSLVQKFSDRGQRDPYNYERTQIWMKSLSMIANYPILGVGTGRFLYVSKLFTPAVDGTIGRYQKWANIAHSEYLQYLAELGIPVAMLMFAIGGYLFRLAWKRSATIAPESRLAQEAALLAAVGLGIHAVVDNNWTVPVVAAGLAVISLADILPCRPWPFVIEWTPVKKTALVLCGTAVFVQAVAIPVFGLYFNELGHQAFVAKDLESAEKMHRLGLGFVPDHPVMLDNLGMVYFDMYVKTRKPEYLDRAEARFYDSLAANPSLDRSAGHLENTLFQRLTGDPLKDQPIHRLIVATERHRIQYTPFNPFIRKNLAEALYNLGEKQQAIEELRKAVELEPNYVPAYLQLGQWIDAAGRTAEAEEYRRKANDIVMHYKDHTTNSIDDTYDAILLGRPLANTGKP